MPASVMEDFTKIEKIGEGNHCLLIVERKMIQLLILLFSLKALMVLYIKPRIVRLNNL